MAIAKVVVAVVEAVEAAVVVVGAEEVVRSTGTAKPVKRPFL